MNIALFDTQIAKANNSRLFLIKSKLFYAENHHNGNNSERLLPTSITEKFTHEEIEYFFNRMK